MSDMSNQSSLTPPPRAPISYPTYPSPLYSPHLSTILTTQAYLPGVSSLLKSLSLLDWSGASNPPPPLIVYATDPHLLEPAQAIIDTTSHPAYVYDLLSLLPTPLPSATTFASNPTSTRFEDAPRRLLFLLPFPVCCLDCDTVVLSREVYEGLVSLAFPPPSVSSSSPSPTQPATEGFECHAVGNFRNKSGSFNPGPPRYFNCGVMAMPLPDPRPSGGAAAGPLPFVDLYLQSEKMLRRGFNDTEEVLLNILLPGWSRLDVRFNLQKRCFFKNGALWNRVVRGLGNGYGEGNGEGGGGVIVLHSVGGKPWQTEEELGRLDWEMKECNVRERYKEVFEVWRRVERGEGGVTCPESKWT